MAVLIGDTETTGLTPGDIAQLSCIKLINGKIIGYNFWFKLDYMPMGAYRVHNLSVEKLVKLSNGKTFVQTIDDIEEVFDGVTQFYGYNLSIDKRFITEEINRCFIRHGVANKFKGYKDIEWVDIMHPVKWSMGVKKNYKLTDAIAYYNLDKDVRNEVRNVYGVNDLLAHDARYDTVATYLLAKKLDMISEQIKL